MNAEMKRMDVWDAGFHAREAQISLIRAGEQDLASILSTVCAMCDKREKELADEASREREQIDAELNREYERSV